ncbi:MAG: hypothetical protein OWU33_01805 [Firmicutes bacterium]|nr:hypothetical protein [Bacillota bacterium]
MAVRHTVTIPLSSQPDVLFGLKLTDIVWLLLAAVGDLAIWHALRHWVTLRWVGWIGVTSYGIGFAVVRVDDITLAQWLGQWLHFWLSPRLYLP